MRLRVEITWKVCVQAEGRGFRGMKLTAILDAEGFEKSYDTCVWYAEPASERQLEVAAWIYGCVPLALGEIGAAWQVSE